MKKFNKKSLLFVAFALIVIVGQCGTCFHNLMSNLFDTVSELINGNLKSAISTVKNTNDISTEKLLYHDQLIDINSLKNNLTNTRFVQKNDNKTAKCDLDMLSMVNEKRFEKNHLNIVTGKIKDLKNKSESVGADFLYLAVPEKG